MTSDLEARVRRLEDRALISERVIKYAVAVDRRDWEMLADCFTDPVHADYSENGMRAADFARDDLVGIIRDAVSGLTATQHLSPNLVIEFDEHDPDRATCDSYMYAQHHLECSEGGEFFLLRGSYTNHMLRTLDGWRIESLTSTSAGAKARAVSLPRRERELLRAVPSDPARAGALVDSVLGPQRKRRRAR